jgi:hypothetical protein
MGFEVHFLNEEGQQLGVEEVLLEVALQEVGR